MRKNVFTLGCGWFLFATALFCSAGTVSAIVADPIMLGWNAASDVSVRGYVIYYGATNQPTTNRIDTGTNLTVKINNLQAGVTYKIYATSYNTAGIESLPSNQILLTATAIPKLKIARQANGSMRLDYRMSPGAVCAVQFSATMKPGSWRTLTNVTADVAGSIIAQDFSAAQVMQRFYRVAHSPQPLLSALAIALRPDSRIQLSFTAPPGAKCGIEYVTRSTSTNWRNLAHLTADAEGNVHFIDPGALNATSRFYRAVLE